MRNMVHWAQGVRSPTPVFQKYDYGTRCTSLWGLPQGCNQRMYGDLDPPQYPLDAIRVPIALISGAPCCIILQCSSAACRMLWAVTHCSLHLTQETRLTADWARLCTFGVR